jgi:DNA polymerase III epsilon subunit-like protein
MEQMQAAAPKAPPVIRFKNIMIDLETLATSTDAVILSIGAVKFNDDGVFDDKCLYAVCSTDSQLERHISQSTLVWWMEQGDAAKRVFSDPNKMTLEEALHEVKAYIDRDDYLLWSNGADFDIPILNHALKHAGLEPMVKHWNHRCFRTMKEEYKMVQKPPFDGTQHNALMDAIHQAKWLCDILAFKRTNGPRPASGFGSVKSMSKQP